MPKGLPKLVTNNLSTTSQQKGGSAMNSPVTPSNGVSNRFLFGSSNNNNTDSKLKLKGVLDKFKGNFNGKVVESIIQ